MRIIEFIDKELAGFAQRLELAYRPPCKTGKSHKYKKDEKGSILDVCEKCGWSREKYQSLSKKRERGNYDKDGGAAKLYQLKWLSRNTYRKPVATNLR